MSTSPQAPKAWRGGSPRAWPTVVPKLWRVRGKARDGLVVTLGRYETEPEAQADLLRLTRSGSYRNLELQPIAVQPPTSAPGASPLGGDVPPVAAL